ncbi:type VII secretion protein EssB [Terribacillus saccharophilus]|uniref:Type VII secretion protein EssB n=1 Tax=Terribacillus saccharophilus TaxID=361277 RepID=A0A268A991_9BACI|nr:type VII secretion protein EssB [Terribacillus saccharophilus]PAD20684.1 type VII secretion protein EssB [Terribacillus saccharophilus]PAF34396.1 type VII secretion protein EssB [Terribacillus saccharophilus]
MNERKIELDNAIYTLQQDKQAIRITMPKSQTTVKGNRQLYLMHQPSDQFVPMEVQEEEDTLAFIYNTNPNHKKWSDIQKLRQDDKLRILSNIGKLERYLSSRITFFLHPDNLVFDENLMSQVIHRGVRDIVPPFDMQSETFLKQYKCLSIAMFSKKYSFDQLYHGSLENANESDFEKKIQKLETIKALRQFLQESYAKEQKKTDKTMSFLPTKRFRLYKRLSIIMIILSVLLAAPLIYLALIKDPFQDKQLEAHGEFLANNYNDVISTLAEEDPEKMPSQTKYTLAYSYIQVEALSDEEKESILKNVTLKSDQDYLLYWIYNGRGELDTSLDKAKYIDDPQLIIYGLIKKIEQVKNNPHLSGTDRDRQVEDLQNQLDKMLEEYNLDPLGEESETEAAPDQEAASEEQQNVQEENNDENKEEK